MHIPNDQNSITYVCRLYADATDIRVKLDRNNLPEFKLDFDNNIILGMPKLLHLEVEIDVSGKAYNIHLGHKLQEMTKELLL